MSASAQKDNSPPLGGRQIMTPAEVAAAFRADPKTVTRWAARGRLSSFRTPGGHRRYYADEVQALINGSVQHREGQQ